MLNKTTTFLIKFCCALFFQITYLLTAFYLFITNRNFHSKNPKDIFDINFIKKIFLGEVNRLLILVVISTIFLSIVYCLIYRIILNRKFNFTGFIKDLSKYIVPIFFSFLLLFPLLLIFLISIGIISIPSILIAIPVLSGKESLFILAVILWIITLIIILFAILRFNLYLNFWHPGIFIFTKNIFKAFKISKKFTSIHYWHLLPFSLLSVLTFGGLVYVNIYGLISLYNGKTLSQLWFLWIFIFIIGIFSTIFKLYFFTIFNKKIRQ